MKKVYFVGAGPGEPELITVKGLKILKKADVIIYDRLISKKLLKYAKKNAECKYVGKTPYKSAEDKHTETQKKIICLLVENAQKGKLVVRLKGGDPFVFGRISEEIKALKGKNISYEVIPGLTSAAAVPELAGIPLTDRKLSSSFVVVTGREAGRKEKKVDFSRLDADTIVILMGVKSLKKIIEEISKTRSRKTPVAIIEKGATKKQKVIIGTLENIVQKAEKTKISPPSVIVIGEVVKLRKLLFEQN